MRSLNWERLAIVGFILALAVAFWAPIIGAIAHAIAGR